MKRVQFKIKEKPILTSVLVAVIVAVVVGISTTALVAYLALNKSISFMSAEKFIYAAHMVGLLVGCITLLPGNSSKGMLLPLVVSAAYTLVMLGGNILFMESNISIHLWDVMCAFIPGIITSLIMIRRAGGSGRVKIRR